MWHLAQDSTFQTVWHALSQRMSQPWAVPSRLLDRALEHAAGRCHQLHSTCMNSSSAGRQFGLVAGVRSVAKRTPTSQGKQIIIVSPELFSAQARHAPKECSHRLAPGTVSMSLPPPRLSCWHLQLVPSYAFRRGGRCLVVLVFDCGKYRAGFSMPRSNKLALALAAELHPMLCRSSSFWTDLEGGSTHPARRDIPRECCSMTPCFSGVKRFVRNMVRCELFCASINN